VTETFVAGFLRSPHGLTGELKAESASGEVAHLLRLKQATLRRRDGSTVTLDVERIEAHGPQLYVKFAGYGTPEAAAALTGAEIIVARKDASPLAPGEVYVEDLKGCGLWYGGQQLATVVAVLDAGAGSLLEVSLLPSCSAYGIEAVTAKSGQPRRVLVPFKDRFIGDVDVAAGKVALRETWVLE
jgi:16S rRNA processing protein RimM